ncbi:MAG TPA: hypothetical protein VN843_20455, partial [Anaerolineales bacterium]|nr:hypothetical protein [Anaerolineales bacterium]
CHEFSLPRCANDSIVLEQKKFVLPLVHTAALRRAALISEVIKLFVTIVCQISKFKFKHATGLRHSVPGSVRWMLRDASVSANRVAIYPSMHLLQNPGKENIPLLYNWD